MPRGKPTDAEEASARTQAAPVDAPEDGRWALARFLRALAERIEHDPTLAEALVTLLRQSGLPLAGPSAAEAARSGGRASVARTADGREAPPPPPDPFAVLREEGEAGLRARLGGLDLPELRQIVRRYRLDPARLSARWASRERVIDLIAEQVRARANLGRAFERV